MIIGCKVEHMAYLASFIFIRYIHVHDSLHMTRILFLRATGAAHHSFMKIKVGNFIYLILRTL